MLITACDVEDLPVDEYDANGYCSSPKVYDIVVGTRVDKSGTNYTSNPTGSIRIKSDAGGTFALRNKTINVNIGGDYVVNGLNGEYTSTLEYSGSFKTDDDADFRLAVASILKTKNAKEKVVKITRLQVVLTALEDGESYQKTYNFSNASIWDVVTGLGTVFADLQLTEIAHEKGQCLSKRVLDIDGDIILTRIPTSKLAQQKKNVVNTGRASGKEISEPKQASPKSSSSKAVQR